MSNKLLKAAYFSYKLEKEKLYVASRNEQDKNYVNSLINSKWIHWSKITKVLYKVDVLINCTSIGFGNQEKFSPIDKEDLSKLKKELIEDIKAYSCVAPKIKYKKCFSVSIDNPL